MGRLRSILLSLLLLAAPAMSSATQPPDLFDFWVGDWDVSWKAPDGSTGRGRNRIAKVLDGSVIEENFEETPDGKTPPLKGRSLSVRHKSGIWKQAWADNQGGYFSLTGQVDGDKRIFITDPVQGVVQRMVFHSIRADSLTWDWERSEDGGKSWKLLWRIDYRRR